MPTTLRHPNLAQDKDFRQEVKDVVIPLLRDTRRDRRTLRETWMRYHRIWSGTRDQEAYGGRQQVYFAKGRKIIDNWVRRLKRDLFPQDDWFNVKAMRDSYARREAPTEALLSFFAKGDTNLRRNATPWLRQLVTLGTSPVKVLWNEEQESVDVMREMLDPDGSPTGKIERLDEIITKRLGPTFKPVDLFAWYVAPVTCMDVDDAVLVFEDLMVSRRRIEARGEQWIADDDHSLGTIYDPEAVEALSERMGSLSEKTRDKYDAEARRLSDKGFSNPLDTKLPSKFRPVDLTQCAWNRVDPDTGVRCRYLVEIAMDDEILRIQRVPWMHGGSCWLAGKFTEVLDEFYGRGLPEVFDRLQYTLNDTGNQSLDSLTYSINPITIVDLYQVQDPTSLRFRPGAKWLANPNAVKAMEANPEPAVVGLNAVGTLMATMGDLADIVPIGGGGKSGSRGRGAGSTAGMQLAISEAQVDVHDVVENLEDQVMNPWLRRAHSLAIQYLSEPMILRVTGRDGQQIIEQKVDQLDLLGDFQFSWLGSSSVLNQQVRSQQMINYLQIASRIPPEAWQAEGKRVSLANLMADIWTVGFGLPNVQRIVQDLHPNTGTDPTIENDLFRLHRGADVEVSEADDDDAHLAAHQRLKVDSPPDQAALMQHMRRHMAAKMAKQMLAQQQQQQQAAQQAGGGPGAPAGGNGSGPGPAFNPGRMAQTTEIGDVLRGQSRGQG